MPAPAPSPLAVDASLHLLVDHLTDALACGELEPSLLHVGGVTGDGFDLGLKPLDGAHPTGELLGLDAPETWHAVGVASHGWAFDLDRRADPARDRARVHTVTVVSRTGEIAHRVRSDDLPDLERWGRADAVTGEQVDLLHRCLGLSTGPPPCDSGVFWSGQWLHALLAGDAPVSWDEALSRHAAMRLLRHGDGAVVDDTADIVAAFHRVCSWSRLRRLTADGAFAASDLRATDAAWLDDGSFARFVLNRSAPLSVLRARVAVELGPLGGRVLALLDELDVPSRSWPDDVGSPPS